MFMIPSVETHIGFLNQTIYGMENIHLQSSKKRGMDGGGRVSEDLTETVALNNGLNRVSPVDILGNSQTSQQLQRP